MRLVCCHIENFGRLRNFDYEFEEGVNIICRENGWGKSTFSVFLRAMFYGFSGSRRKKTEENERERYRPWQGGVYGGRLVFETRGKKYELTRVFGRKESDDEFELRDLETNLLCGDYSSKIGEELFCLDRDSFSRTVFTGQQDSRVAATDDVNALVADLTERAGDMGGYEAALKRLTETVNRLTPRRASGSLSRRAEEIRRLERETAAGRELSGRLAICEKKERDEAGREECLTAELKSLSLSIESAAAEEEAARRVIERETLHAGNREVRRRLFAVRDSRRKELEEASSVFPGRVPSRAEIEEQLVRCRKMERLEAKIQAEMPDDEEQDRLSELEKIFRDREDSDGPAAAAGSRSRREKKSFGNETAYLMIMSAGAVILATGLIGTILTQKTAFAFLCAAGAVIAGLCLSRFKAGRPAEEDPEEQPERDAGRREYEALRRKERRVEELYAEWSDVRRPALRFLKELGFAPQDDLLIQLENLRDAADDCEDAGRLLREAESELRTFESEMRSKGISLSPGDGAAKKISDPPGGEKTEKLRRRTGEVHAALLSCRERRRECRHELEELRAEYEEWEYSMQRLAELRELQTEEEKRYRQAAAAASNLQAAKEALTARYADPITGSFRRYWEQITGYSAAGIHVDAESRVTVEERGKQRRAALLSAGYRDLAGICLRVALADAMYPAGRRERPPLIMDDPFTSLDDEKMEGAMRFLRDAGNRYQIIYFTCSAARC